MNAPPSPPAGGQLAPGAGPNRAVIGTPTYAKCTLRLSGHACEACALKLERKAEAIPGVRRANATFLGAGTMNISFDRRVLDAPQVEVKLKAAGAPVKPFSADEVVPTGWRSWLHGDRREITFTAATLLFMLLGWLSTRSLPALPAVGAACYVLAYVTGGFFGVQAGWQSLRQATVDVDLLMVLAALGAAFVGAPFEGAMLLFLFSLSNVLQAYAIDRTRKAISSLMKLRPTQALCRRGGETRLLPIEELIVGDVLIVRPGESIALDGIVTEGASTLDEAMLTGESMPVSKSVGSAVFGGTMNQTGSLEIRVSKLAQDSTIAKLIQLVEQAQGEKANTQRFLEKAEQTYALSVIALTAGLVLIPWLVFAGNFHDVFYRAMTVMVVASPCALIISTPASILSAIGGAARRGAAFSSKAARTSNAWRRSGCLPSTKPARSRGANPRSRILSRAGWSRLCPANSAAGPSICSGSPRPSRRAPSTRWRAPSSTPPRTSSCNCPSAPRSTRSPAKGRSPQWTNAASALAAPRISRRCAARA